MVDAPVEILLREIVKGVKKEPIIIETGRSTSGIKLEPGIKKEEKSPNTPIPSKSSTSKSGGCKKAEMSGATKGILKKIGFNPKFVEGYDTDEDGGYTPKGKGNGKGKHKKLRKPRPRSCKRLGRFGPSHETRSGLRHGQHGLRIDPFRPPPGDEGKRVCWEPGLTFKNGWERLKSKFVGQGISTCGDWHAVIPVSII